MIAFRAPSSLAAQLNNAATITGKDKTFLILEAIKSHLPHVVDRYSGEYQMELDRKKEEFMRSMNCPPPEKPKRKPAK